MERTINSSAQVPREMYVERTADVQIKRIISEMARPGYVLVARQMGKTNLLLHTKELLQDNRNIYVFVDFSIMSGYSEQECLNTLIDLAIEANFAIFAKAEDEIIELRQKPTYKAIRMFNRELRILLQYVDKIVFILDEIDALTRTEYSDKIFSLIRGHYYANANFPELKRATYILSGVIEPKDIIKDPDISPFNIGEKIYMGDFTRVEFQKLINSSDYLNKCSADIIDRLYYWTKGQPRMSWDLCNTAEKTHVTSLAEVDNLVQEMYLTTYDLAPVDSIRDKVKADSELRDALIQLSIDKGNSLSDDVKSKLYLAGIIGYEQTVPGFKNPILARSLSYDWLLSLHSQELNYLSVADKSIHLERDYKKAISHLTKFLDSNPTDVDEVDKAHYLMGEAYYRMYQPEQSLKFLETLNKRGKLTKFYNQSLLLRGYTLASNEQFKDAEKCYRDLMNDANILGTGIYFKAVIGLVDVLVSQNILYYWQEAERILKEHIEKWRTDLIKENLLATIMYYSACIEEKRGNLSQCVMYIDSALQFSQLNERPYLLYKKLKNGSKDAKEMTAKELFESLSDIKKRPEPEDFDNTLGFNLMYASQILAELMLYYPQYDVTSYLRFFLYESKENAVTFIYELLIKYEDPNAKPFFLLILNLLESPEWFFDDNHRCSIGLNQLREFNDPSVCKTVLSKIENNEMFYFPELTIDVLTRLTFFYIKNNGFREAERVIAVFRDKESQINIKPEGKMLLISYYECLILFKHRDMESFPKKGASLLDRVTKYKSNYSNAEEEQISMKDVDTIINSLKKWLADLEQTLRRVGVKSISINLLGRNTRIRVRYIANNEIVEKKYKQLEEDLNLGICTIEEILDR